MLRADGIMIMHQNFSRVSHGVKLSQQLYCRFTISIVAIDYDTGKFSHSENNITTVWYYYGFSLALKLIKTNCYKIQQRCIPFKYTTIIISTRMWNVVRA